VSTETSLAFHADAAEHTINAFKTSHANWVRSSRGHRNDRLVFPADVARHGYYARCGLRLPWSVDGCLVGCGTIACGHLAVCTCCYSARETIYYPSGFQQGPRNCSRRTGNPVAQAAHVHYLCGIAVGDGGHRRNRIRHSSLERTVRLQLAPSSLDELLWDSSRSRRRIPVAVFSQARKQRTPPKPPRAYIVGSAEHATTRYNGNKHYDLPCA